MSEFLERNKLATPHDIILTMFGGGIVFSTSYLIYFIAKTIFS